MVILDLDLREMILAEKHRIFLKMISDGKELHMEKAMITTET